MIDNNELKIIEEISKKKSLTQRDISQNTNLSLGSVNLIIKRLIKRGFVKTVSLNPKKIDYILTSEGFSQKAKKSYQYVLKTIDLVKAVREEIAKIILEEFNQGQKKFVVLGDDDLADIIELALKGFDYKRVVTLEDIKDSNALVLTGIKGKKVKGFRYINIKDRLGEFYWGVD